MRHVLWLAAILAGCANNKSSEGIFREAEGTGLEFVHKSGASGKFYMTEIMGAGAALLDYDNDGDLDALLVQSPPQSKLFRNDLEKGSLRFSDATSQSGIQFAGYGMGAATGDYNNDGWMDLLITGHNSRALFRNDRGRFTLVDFPQPAGVWSTSASFFDYDRDGRLDLIILSYVNFTEAGNKSCQAPTGEPDYCTPRAYSPVAARLYHNDGGDRFSDVTAKAGIDRALGPGLGVAAGDLNDDGWPDLFVANDTAQNHVWINRRDGTFKELGLESGAAFSEDGLAKAGMGVAVGDADIDGDEDLFVVNLMREGATLFRKERTGASGVPVFFDVSRQTRLYTITFDFTGFGTEWFDYDNDGDLDLFIANGAVTRREEQRGQPVPFREKNLLIRNDGGKFTDVTAVGGPPLERAEVTRGAAFGDIDNDGDVDVLITNNNAGARLLLNNSPKSSWVSVRAVDGNRDALGARVTAIRDGLPDLVRRVHTDSSYLSASDVRVHFGLGSTARVQQIVIRWSDGISEGFVNPQINTVVTLKRGSGR
jgi:hypothetical protein